VSSLAGLGSISRKPTGTGTAASGLGSINAKYSGGLGLGLGSFRGSGFFDQDLRGSLSRQPSSSALGLSSISRNPSMSGLGSLRNQTAARKSMMAQSRDVHHKDFLSFDAAKRDETNTGMLAAMAALPTASATSSISVRRKK
jgi:hypothetical protein